MKRLFLCIFILMLLLCSCAAEQPPESFAVPSPPVQAEEAPVKTPEPTPQPTPTPVPEPTPEPDALDAKDGTYTIGWISDTQHYSKKYYHYFYKMTEFLANEQDRMNLGYIVHTGDLVHNYDIEEQWTVADKAMRTIDHIPNGVLAGNHDFDNDKSTYAEYGNYFGEARYADKPWYGGSYENNRCHYDLITLGETDYLFVYISFQPDSNCISWANEVFAQHPDRVGILCLHDYYKMDTTRSPDGETIFKKIVKNNPNLYMVLCGHRYTLFAEDTPFDDDGDGEPNRTVHQALANYQAAGDEGGSGYMRFLQVDEAAGKIRMYSYSPAADDYTYFDLPERMEEKYASDPKYEEYEIDIPWKE